MTIQSDIIYHCVSCGRVVHVESEAEPPQCCGHAMAIAVPETTENAVVGDKMAENAQTPLTTSGREKPR